jgi:hypothetical protein
MANPKVHEKAAKSVAKTCEKLSKKGKADVSLAEHVVIPIGDEVTSGESMGQFLKSNIPFMKGSLRIDTIQLFKFNSTCGEFYIGHPWSGKYSLHPETFGVFGGRLPETLVLGRSAMGSWGFGQWEDVSGRTDTLLPEAAETTDFRIKPEIVWDPYVGTGQQVKLKWGIAAIPFDPERFFLTVQRIPIPKFLSFVDSFTQFLEADTVTSIKGNGETCFPFLPKSIFVLPQLYPDMIAKATFPSGKAEAEDID